MSYPTGLVHQEQYANPAVNQDSTFKPYLPGCSPLNLSSRGKRTKEYLESHKNVEKRRRDRINNCLETIRQVSGELLCLFTGTIILPII